MTHATKEDIDTIIKAMTDAGYGVIRLEDFEEFMRQPLSGSEALSRRCDKHMPRVTTLAREIAEAL